MYVGTPLMIEVGAGELLDKLTILRIKLDHVADPAKLVNIRHEEKTLADTRRDHLPDSPTLLKLEDELRAVNERLWQIEERIRACEREQDFGERFIELARSVYQQNDLRAEIKKKINLFCGSTVIEEKSYNNEASQ